MPPRHPTSGAPGPWKGAALASPHVRHYPANISGRDFVVGDLHGCLEPLHRLLTSVGFQPAIDRVFSVGDNVDRGPMSFACLKLLRQPWFHSCRGNHEDLLLTHLTHIRQHPPYESDWLHRAAPRFSDRQSMAQEWGPLLRELPEVIVVGAGTPGRFHVVHGELLEDGRSVTDALIDTWMFRDAQKAAYRALWGRVLLATHERQGQVRRAHDPVRMSPTYCGHTIVPEVIQLARQIFLDRGAFLGLVPNAHLNGGELETQLPEPGLVLAEPKTGRFWLAPTTPGEPQPPVRSIACLTPITR